MNAERLDKAVRAVCPIIGVSIGTTGVSASVRIDFDQAATPAQKTAGQNVVNAFDWSQAAQDASDNLDARTQALALLSDPAGQLKVLRALMLVLLDENNVTREWIAAFKVQTAAATSLANLQTRVAALPDMPDRTAGQLRTAITSKINAGTADA